MLIKFPTGKSIKFDVTSKRKEKKRKIISIIKQNTKFPKREVTFYLKNATTLNYFGNRARYKKIN